MKRFLFALLFVPLVVFAQTPAQELLTHLNGIHSMQAGFTQVVRSGERVLHQTKGKMALQRAGNFRWETEEPMQQLIVTNGHTIWVFDKDLKQVTVRPTKNNGADSPAALLSGHSDKLVAYYNVAREEEGPYINFVLRPKNPKQNFTYILFRFEKNELLQMQLVDQMGQNSDLRFSKIMMNQHLPASFFELQIPTGVDVIKE